MLAWFLTVVILGGGRIPGPQQPFTHPIRQLDSLLESVATHAKPLA